eukprot:4951532-Karenia_brevis.AAC.1
MAHGTCGRRSVAKVPSFPSSELACLLKLQTDIGASLRSRPMSPFVADSALVEAAKLRLVSRVWYLPDPLGAQAATPILS